MEVIQEQGESLSDDETVWLSSLSSMTPGMKWVVVTRKADQQQQFCIRGEEGGCSCQTPKLVAWPRGSRADDTLPHTRTAVTPVSRFTVITDWKTTFASTQVYTSHKGPLVPLDLQAHFLSPFSFSFLCAKQIQTWHKPFSSWYTGSTGDKCSCV